MTEELLNLYDADGRVVGAKPRREAKASGLAVGAINALVVDGRRHVLLQRRPHGKENGERWDKSVGGHVSAGEQFDQTLVREAGEELFDDARSPRIRLAASGEEFASLLRRPSCPIRWRRTRSTSTMATASSKAIPAPS